MASKRDANLEAASGFQDGPIRRAVDVAVALPLLLVALPVLLVAAVLVKLDSGGPVIYRQARVGRGGKTFSLYKIRTMHIDADRGALVTGARDPRITRIGAVLRPTKLDELPQLWNVLRGDMTLIGPRPEVDRYVRFYLAHESAVLDVRPGLTGPGQLHYTDELAASLDRVTDPETCYIETQLHPKLAVELKYLSQRSLWADLRILLGTAVLLLRSFKLWRSETPHIHQGAGGDPVQDRHGRRLLWPRRPAFYAVIVVVVLVCGFSAAIADRATRQSPPFRYRYITDSSGAEVQAVTAGFNLLDTGPWVPQIAHMPAHARALVWVGNYNNASCTWSIDTSKLIQLIRPIEHNPRVAAFYLADEPHVSACPSAPRQLAARSRLVHQLDKNAFTYAVIEDGDSHPGEYAAFRGTVDVIGLDPYPCTFRHGCRYDKIDEAVRRARAAGLTNFWGVVQAFQDDYYRYPTAAELKVILSHWHASGAAGEQVFSWSYAGHTLSHHPDLVAVLRRDNLGH